MKYAYAKVTETVTARPTYELQRQPGDDHNEDDNRLLVGYTSK